MKQSLNPRKVFAWGILVLVYLFLTLALLGNLVPTMLREADTAMNLLAVAAVACWLYITYTLWFLIQKRKPKNNRRNRR